MITPEMLVNAWPDAVLVWGIMAVAGVIGSRLIRRDR